MQRTCSAIGLGLVLGTASLWQGSVAHADSGWVCSWEMLASSGPSPRAEHAMAHHAGSGMTVLFGGEADESSTVYNDTWLWDGVEWTEADLYGPSPSARYGAAIAYDSVRDVVVLHGGTAGGGVRNDETWEWDGGTWTQIPVSGPGPLTHASMVFDSDSGVIVYFGGRAGGNDYRNETWEWDGTDWEQRSVSGPGARRLHAMTYDNDRGVVVLFGGINVTTNTYYDDTWEWDGDVWTDVSTPGPEARNGMILTYDANLQRCVLYGGNGRDTAFGDTWHWNGSTQTWTLLEMGSPGARYVHAAAFNTGTDEIVMFGGYDPTTDLYLGDSWSLRDCRCLADLNSDGVIDLEDVNLFISAFLAGCP